MTDLVKFLEPNLDVSTFSLKTAWDSEMTTPSIVFLKIQSNIH